MIAEERRLASVWKGRREKNTVGKTDLIFGDGKRGRAWDQSSSWGKLANFIFSHVS